MTRNPNFRVWSKAARPDGNAEEIVFSIVPQDDDRLVTDVARGRADISLLIPTERTSEVRTRYASQLHVVPEQATVYVFLNTKIPPFDDIRVRRALNYAIDRRRVVELRGGTSVAQPTCQVVPPTTAGYVRYCPTPSTLAGRASGRHRISPGRSG